ncbi:MAG: electron transfer flavoprotein subunit beta/FixA family protein [Firmicutes bacterium]|nr:electron transfer flavoprotein subunit beta/FixA family protein [Bacillota bacterium]
MKILVCAKQVPDTTEMKIDPETNTLIRKGVPSILNTYDSYALEQALQLKDRDPENTKVVVVSMGPPQAEGMLRDCLAVGADEAYLVTDRKFGGSDTLATSYILSQAVEKLQEEDGPFDAIFCGKQAIDGDTAQVGPELAEHMDIPQITYGLNVEVKDGKAVIERELDSCHQIVETQMPFLATFNKTDELRYARVRNALHSKKAEIKYLTFDEFPNIDTTSIGLKGSPTRVVKSYTPESHKEGIRIQEADPNLAAKRLVSAMEHAKVL